MTRENKLEAMIRKYDQIVRVVIAALKRDNTPIREEMPYLIVINTATGESVRLEFK